MYCPKHNQPIPVLPACPGDNKQTNQVSQIMPNHFGSVILQSSSQSTTEYYYYVPLLYFFFVLDRPLCSTLCSLHRLTVLLLHISIFSVTGVCIGQTSLMSRSPSCTSSNLISLFCYTCYYYYYYFIILLFYSPPVTSNFLHPSWSILHHFAASCKLNPNSLLSSLSLSLTDSHSPSISPHQFIQSSICSLFVLVQDPPGIPIFFNSSSFLSWMGESWSATR